jgi:feruloyl esterase
MPFLNHAEVTNDFAHQLVHFAPAIGRQTIEAYYGAAPSKSRRSTSGREDSQAASTYPEDYSGIVGGTPVVDFNHHLGSSRLKTLYLGAPYVEFSPAFISSTLLTPISKEILRQCDAGLVDDITPDPDDCDFEPEALLCAEGSTNRDCLARPPS